MVAPTRRQASSSAVAVSVRGAVTSMSANAVVMPSAGPNTANGANAATNRSSGPMSYRRRSASRSRAQLSVAVANTLGRTGRARREHHGSGVVRGGAGVAERGRTGRGGRCRLPQLVDDDRPGPWCPAQHPGGHHRSPRPHHVEHASGTHGGPEAAQPEATVGHDGDSTDPPAGVHHREQVDARRHEHRHTITGAHPSPEEPPGHAGHQGRELGVGDAIVGRGVVDGHVGGRGEGVDLRPQRCERRLLAGLGLAVGLGLGRDRPSGGDRRLDEGGDRDLEHGQVAGIGDAVHGHVGEAAGEVVGEVVVEHGVSCPPHESYRQVQP